MKPGRLANVIRPSSKWIERDTGIRVLEVGAERSESLSGRRSAGVSNICARLPWAMCIDAGWQRARSALNSGRRQNWNSLAMICPNAVSRRCRHLCS